MASILQTVGSWLAMVFAGYAVFLLVGAVAGVHAVVLLATAYATRPDRWASTRLAWLVLPVEVFYGLLNPLIYLLVLVRVAKGPALGLLVDQAWWLLAPAWLLLVALWGARVLGRHPDQDGEVPRLTTRVVLGAGSVVVVVYLVKDAAPMVVAVVGSWPGTAVDFELVRPALLGVAFGTGWLSLYLVPLLLLVAHLRATATPSAWAAERRFLLGGIRAVRPAALAMTALAAISVVVSLRWSSEASVRALVLDRRARIVTAARRQGIDPRLLASLVYVVQRDTVSQLTLGLEELVMGAWLGDPRDDFGLATALDASIGLAQIKPTTAIHGARIHLTATSDPVLSGLWRKDLRPGNAVEPFWKLPARSFAGVELPLVLPLEKPQIVEQLFTDDGSLAIAAFILALYEAQWRSVYPHLDLSGRPEITATLYQIGFARSRPHAAPRANAFGEEVGRVFRSPWIQESFGTPPETSASRPPVKPFVAGVPGMVPGARKSCRWRTGTWPGQRGRRAPQPRRGAAEARARYRPRTRRRTRSLCAQPPSQTNRRSDSRARSATDVRKAIVTPFIFRRRRRGRLQVARSARPSTSGASPANRAAVGSPPGIGRERHAGRGLRVAVRAAQRGAEAFARRIGGCDVAVDDEAIDPLAPPKATKLSHLLVDPGRSRSRGEQMPIKAREALRASRDTRPRSDDVGSSSRSRKTGKSRRGTAVVPLRTPTSRRGNVPRSSDRCSQPAHRRSAWL